MENWVKGAAPESSHPFDMRRFYEIIFQCLVSEDRFLSEDVIEIAKEHLKWDEAEIQKFARRKTILAENILGFVEFLKSEKNINVYNQLK